MPLATRQNTTNTTTVRANGRAWPSTPAAAGAAKTSTFLIHCLGRRSQQPTRQRRPPALRPGRLGRFAPSDASANRDVLGDRPRRGLVPTHEASILDRPGPIHQCTPAALHDSPAPTYRTRARRDLGGLGIASKRTGARANVGGPSQMNGGDEMASTLFGLTATTTCVGEAQRPWVDSGGGTWTQLLRVSSSSGGGYPQSVRTRLPGTYPSPHGSGPRLHPGRPLALRRVRLRRPAGLLCPRAGGRRPYPGHPRGQR